MLEFMPVSFCNALRVTSCVTVYICTTSLPTHDYVTEAYICIMYFKSILNIFM